MLTGTHGVTSPPLDSMACRRFSSCSSLRRLKNACVTALRSMSRSSTVVAGGEVGDPDEDEPVLAADDDEDDDDSDDSDQKWVDLGRGATAGAAAADEDAGDNGDMVMVVCSDSLTP